jgi:hypothetical protein
MEIVGVTGGVINSTYTTFGTDLPNTLAGYVPAVPMVALAVAELGRVPLASVIYHKQKLMQGVALLGIVALGYLAVENWTFGFERIVDLRLRSVTAAGRELSRAEAELSALVAHRTQMTGSSGQARDELRRGIVARDASILELNSQLSKEAEVHDRNLEDIRKACRIVREACMVPRSQEEDSRYRTEVGRVSAELARQREDRKRLQSKIDDFVSSDSEKTAEIEQKIDVARTAVIDAREIFRKAAEGNQVYRLAASWFGVNTSDVTAEQFATARWVFATFSAVAVALAGTIAALVYYAGSRVPDKPTPLAALMTKVARSCRAYYARKRRPIVREIVGPERVIYRDGKEPATVVEKEVPRFIDQIVLIPRWGIKAPIHVNGLLSRHNGRERSDYSTRESVDGMSNVTPLGKKVG